MSFGSILNGQCHDFLDPFLSQKPRPLPYVNRQKRFREIVRVSEDIREKRVYIYVVVDYAETTMTTQTTTENCGGLSLILKEQSSEFVCVHISNSKILKI